MADVEAVELLVLDRKEPETGGKYNSEGYALRVVQWVYDKRDGSVGAVVKLERRKLFLKDGVVTSGKADGLSLGDLAKIRERWVEIIKAMKTPPPAGRKQDTLDPPAEAVEDLPF